MIAGMVWLGAACVALGVAPGYAMRLLDAPTAGLLHGPGASAVLTARGPLVLSTGLTASGTDATAISMTAWPGSSSRSPRWPGSCAADCGAPRGAPGRPGPAG